MKSIYGSLALVVSTVLLLNPAQAASLPKKNSDPEPKIHTIYLYQNQSTDFNKDHIQQEINDQFDRLERTISHLSEATADVNRVAVSTLRIPFEVFEIFLTSERLQQLTALAGESDHYYACSDQSEFCSYHITFSLLNAVNSERTTQPRQVSIVMEVALPESEQESGWQNFKSRFYASSQRFCPGCALPEVPPARFEKLINNVKYYGNLFGVPLFKILSFQYARHGERMDMSGGIKDHMTNNQILSAGLELDKAIPTFFKDHNLVVISPEIDGGIVTFSGVLAGTAAVKQGGLTINKSAISPEEMTLYYLSKAACTMFIRARNQHHMETTYSKEPDSGIRRAWAYARTSLEFATPLAVKHFALGQRFEGNMLLAITADNAFNSAVSNIATPVIALNQKLLGEWGYQIQRANTHHVARQVSNGLSHMLSAGEFLVIGSALRIYMPKVKGYVFYTPYVIFSTLAKHTVKVSGYMVMDAIKQSMESKEVDTGTKMLALSAISFVADNVLYRMAVALKASPTAAGQAAYQVLSALAPGYGSRFATYSYRSLYFSIFTLSYFLTGYGL